MKRIVLLLVIAAIGGVMLFSAAGNAIQNRNAEKAAQDQMEAYQAQELVEKLPDWGQTLIITIGVLYGMETFGPKLLLVAGLTSLGGLVIVIIFLMQVLTLFSRPTSVEAYKYSFKTSLVIAGIIIVIGGAMLYNIPGGGDLVRKLAFYAGVFGFFAMGGGFGLRAHGGKFKSVTDEHGNTTTEAEGPKLGMSVSGRGRTSANSDIVKWE